MSRNLTILSGSQVDKVISALDLEAALTSQATVFKAFSTQSSPGQTQDGTGGEEETPAIQTPLRSKILSAAATSLFMPSRVEAIQTTACKIVSIPRGGSLDGLPGTTVVLDNEGNTLGVVNARKLTALRNAAGSALFLRACPPSKPPTSLLIFGSGAQAHSHASMFLRLWPGITTCTLVNRRQTSRADDLISALQSAFPKTTFSLCISGTAPPNEVDDLVQAASVIITVTSSTAPLFNSKYVQPGTRLVLVGSYTPQMREVDDALIRRAGVIVVDSKEACGHEAGELLSAGIGPEGMVELGEVLLGAETGKVGGGEDIKIFKSVGIGIQDVAIAKLVLDQAQGLGVGTVIDGWD